MGSMLSWTMEGQGTGTMKVFDPDGFRRALAQLSSGDQNGGLSGAESFRLQRSLRARRRGLVFSGLVLVGSLVVHVGSYLGASATLSSKAIAVILHVCAMACLFAVGASRARPGRTEKLWPPEPERAYLAVVATFRTVPMWVVAGVVGLLVYAVWLVSGEPRSTDPEVIPVRTVSAFWMIPAVIALVFFAYARPSKTGHLLWGDEKDED